MHEIDFTTGRPAIAYKGEKPWHGYGEIMLENQPLDVWRVAAGLDWDVISRPVEYSPYLQGDRATMKRTFKGRKVLLRNDTFGELSIVSDRFKVVQPARVLEFFKSLIEKNGFKMNTAGALRDGKRVWALAETGDEFSMQNDKVAAYLLLATAFDGTFSTTAQFTSIRVVCNNTLGFALERGGEGGVIKVPHNQEFNSYDVKNDLGLEESWVTFRDNVMQFAQHKVTKREALNYFLTVMGVTEEDAADGKQLSNVKKLIAYYDSGPGSQLRSAKGTAWGLVNAVTFLADHGRRAANAGNRFDSASFGSGATLKRKAYEQALVLVEAA